MLTIETTALVVIDVQGNLAQSMHEKDTLFENVKKMIRGAKALGLPVIATEQYPKGLGPTVPEIRELLDAEPIAKTSFSCCGAAAFLSALRSVGRRQLLLAGIETHVCVYQTAADLLGFGFDVHVPVDAVSSRTAGNRALGIEKMRSCGAALTSVEMALFELLHAAGGDRFKQVLRIVK